MKKAEWIRQDMEHFMYDLQNWLDQALDNDHISDGMYGFVQNMVREVKTELHDLSVDILAGKYDNEPEDDEDPTGARLEIRDKFNGFETIELFYIHTDHDGHESIWTKKIMIRNGEKKVLQDRFYIDASHRPEVTDEHSYLIDFLHKIEETRKQNLDEDDDTTITFHDPQTFAVYSGFMPALRKKIQTIQNKCKKFGCDFHYEEVGEEFREVPTGEVNPVTNEPVKVMCKFILIHAEGTAVVNDWEFVASVEHTEAGNIYSKALTDVEIPVRYRTSDSCTCEHCNTKRIRKNTCIIRNTKTGEFKQVGKSCLKDFTFGMSASTAAWCASLKQIFEEAEVHEPSGFHWYEKHYEPKEILQYAAETIRHFGYSKEKTKELTIRIFDYLHGNTKFWNKDMVAETANLISSVGFNADSPEAVQKASDAIGWIKVQNPTTDYLHNLKTVCALSYVNSGKFGLLISLFPAWDRDLEYQAKKKAEAEAGKASEHVGKIGERITVAVQSVKCITSWESEYGYTYVWKITGTDGNIYTWKTQKTMNEDLPPKTVKGTVKEHKVYREVKQTELTRCKIA